MASSTMTYVISNRTRKEWRGGTEKMSITENSLIPWFYCQICQHKVRNPYCCPCGDVFCKECIINYLLTNKSKKHEIVEKDAGKAEEIEKFMNMQRIVPTQEHLKISESVKTKEKIKKTKKESVKCPVCSTKIKFSKLLSLEIDWDGDVPICMSCRKAITGSVRAKRLSCSHVICDKCYSTVAEKLKQCPRCNASINTEQTLLINKTTIDMRGPDGNIIIKHEGLVDAFG